MEAAAPVAAAPGIGRREVLAAAPVTREVRHALAPEATESGRRADDLSFGVDDPSLLPSLGATALNPPPEGPRRAMTYWVVAEDLEPPAPIAAAGSGHAAAAESRSGNEPFEDVALDEPSDGLRTAASILLGAAAAGAAAIGISTFVGGPVRAAAIGGSAFGALLGWGLSRWKARAS